MAVLSTFVVDSVTPRGGVKGDTVVVLGSGFGLPAGKVFFDPLGVNVEATVTLWQVDRIEFTVPAGLPLDRFSTTLFQRDGASDSANVPFWVPAAEPLVSDGLDFQYPNFEVGPNQDLDDPRIAGAADANRILSRLQVLQELAVDNVDPKDSAQAAGVGDVAGTYDASGGVAARGRLTGMPSIVDGVALQIAYRVLLKAQTAPAENGLWEVLVVGSGADGEWERARDFDEDSDVTSGARTMVVAGTANARTTWVLLNPDPVVVGGPSGDDLLWAPAAGTGGGGGADQRQEKVTPTLGQTVFNLAATPADPSDVQMFVNTVKYIHATHYGVVANQVTWSDFPFSLDAQDTVEFVYFV